MTKENELSVAKRDIVRLETEVNHLTKIVDDMKKSLAEMLDQLIKIRILLSAAQGGWKTIMWLGGACTAIGAALSWIAAQIQHWR